jgi:MFS transporter, ACS family, solute carrier family 17 (sodium-dependent inorganic phosphate cotransporter), other
MPSASVCGNRASLIAVPVTPAARSTGFWPFRRTTACAAPSPSTTAAEDSVPLAKRGNDVGNGGGPDANPVMAERVRVVLLCFAAFVLCNVDRITLSIAVLPMAETYGWSQTTVGVVQSSFFAGYILTQVPGGYLADKYGGRAVLSVGVVAWSAMTLLTPAAASTSLPVLLAARALLGVGEGLAMPAMNAMLSRWVPTGERSKALSFVYSAMYLGSVVGLLSCPLLMSWYGWPSVFYVFGAGGFAWYAAWSSLTSASPETSPTISSSERKYITSNTAPSRSRPLESIPWKMLLSKRPMWAIIVAHFCCVS